MAYQSPTYHPAADLQNYLPIDDVERLVYAISGSYSSKTNSSIVYLFSLAITQLLHMGVAVDVDDALCTLGARCECKYENTDNQCAFAGEWDDDAFAWRCEATKCPEYIDDGKGNDKKLRDIDCISIPKYNGRHKCGKFSRVLLCALLLTLNRI